ncbi:MAG: Methionine aminopeptidase [Candidatus Azambacteria bacterium GW2011_GWF2_46_32]|uniref:Methionine aminopeptidase n=1 Tax=Candidatus Azambacteria bacterium GW2011_GWF2_46_32 TaxID=1618628 RepID=A0A0G1S4G6_9BACT|nr:MAG: Methionine aminopeptidase [Candidatus Azambacteria bacterium GW2011_GWF2_46_32]
MNVTIKKPGEIESLRKGGKILAEILEELTKIAGPGIATVELDRLAEELILKSGGQPSFKGYRGFPSALCISINETVVHGKTERRRHRGS